MSTVKGYNNAVNALRTKWEAINNKTVGELPEKLWNYFYAVEIIALKKELFPEYFEEMERKRQERMRRRQEWDDYINQEFNPFNYFRDIFDSIIDNIKNKIMINKVEKSFAVMGLDKTATPGEINKKFRQLAIQKHPDHGGTADEVRELLNSRQICLDYAMRIND